jgi:glutamate synthase domain-containing protein 1
MDDLKKINNPRGDDKIIDACSIFGMMDTTGKRFPGDGVIKAISLMHDRSNGLGGGFAVYGLFPDYADLYCFHIMYLSHAGRADTEALLKERFNIAYDEATPTRPTDRVRNPPLLWRYFVAPRNRPPAVKEEDYVVTAVMDINTKLKDAFVFSSGKDMCVFKGVGYPEDIAEFFCLDSYRGYLWTAHGRFPTNYPGWWGGAHPFSLLDWTVVHNGEISSYGINRRYLEQYGYICALQTDTEVIAYAVDLLMRRHGLPLKMAMRVLAPPFWSDIEQMDSTQKVADMALRQVYSSLLLNGPFTVIIAHRGEMIGLTDRIRLRPLVCGVKENTLFLSSEESAIRLICPDLEVAWHPVGGEAIVATLGQPLPVPGRLVKC